MKFWIAVLATILGSRMVHAQNYTCNMRGYEEEIAGLFKAAVTQEVESRLAGLGISVKPSSLVVRVNDRTALTEGTRPKFEDMLVFDIAGRVATSEGQTLDILSHAGWVGEGPYIFHSQVKYDSLRADGAFVNGTCWTNLAQSGGFVEIRNHTTEVALFHFSLADFKIYDMK